MWRAERSVDDLKSKKSKKSNSYTLATLMLRFIKRYDYIASAYNGQKRYCDTSKKFIYNCITRVFSFSILRPNIYRVQS